MARRKICIFCETWESGGIESFLRNVLMRMDLSALSVDIAAACLRPSVFTGELEARGVRFRQLSGSPRRVAENRRQFRRLLAEEHYDVVHVNAFQALSLGYLRLAREAGVPVRIAHSHNTDLRKSGTRWLKLGLHAWGRRRYTADATALLACSAAASRFRVDDGALARRGFTFIPNGIGTEQFRFDPAVREAVRRELGLSDRFVVGHVGRLCYQKNQHFLLDVFAQALRLRPESRLLLIGEGGDLDALRERARTLGIADRVVFYGVTDHPEQLLWAMDVFAFPSRFEGLGIVAVEAQAAGLPVVCSEHVPLEAAVTPLFLRVPLEEGPAVWAEALLAAAGTERRAGAEQVRRGGFDIGNVARQVESAYMREWDG